MLDWISLSETNEEEKEEEVFTLASSMRSTKTKSFIRQTNERTKVTLAFRLEQKFSGEAKQGRNFSNCFPERVSQSVRNIILLAIGVKWRLNG